MRRVKHKVCQSYREGGPARSGGLSGVQTIGMRPATYLPDIIHAHVLHGLGHQVNRDSHIRRSGPAIRARPRTTRPLSPTITYPIPIATQSRICFPAFVTGFLSPFRHAAYACRQPYLSSKEATRRVPMKTEAPIISMRRVGSIGRTTATTITATHTVTMNQSKIVLPMVRVPTLGQGRGPSIHRPSLNSKRRVNPSQSVISMFPLVRSVIARTNLSLFCLGSSILKETSAP